MSQKTLPHIRTSPLRLLREDKRALPSPVRRRQLCVACHIISNLPWWTHDDSCMCPCSTL